jgi:hypothetical protein
MDLFWVMLAKGCVLLLWAGVSGYLWPDKEELLPREEQSGPGPAYSPLAIPAPDHFTDTL